MNYLRQDIIHSIIFGCNSAREIARELNRRQSEILTELNTLRSEGLIRPLYSISIYESENAGELDAAWVYFGSPISEPLGAYTCV